MTAPLTGPWLDDLAAVIAGWRDRRPVRNRLLLLGLALVNWMPVGQHELLFLGLLGLALPRLGPREPMRLRVFGALLALGGAVVMVVTPVSLIELVAAAPHLASVRIVRWIGAFLLAFGVLAGARVGRWWPWLVAGAVASYARSEFGWWSVAWWTLPEMVLVILAARVAAVRRDVDVAAARGRLAVELQGSPWAWSFALCLVAASLPGGFQGVFRPAFDIALVALLFHMTWRASSLFDRAAAWTAAVLVPIPLAAWAWLLSSSQEMPWNRTFDDFMSNAFTPRLLVPLALGLLVGRRLPLRRATSAGAFVVVLLLGAYAAGSEWIELRGREVHSPAEWADETRVTRLWATALPALWLVVFHRLATSTVSARRIVAGATVVGVVTLVVMQAAAAPWATLSVGRGALTILGGWVDVAFVLLLARDVACVTRIPDDHPLMVDRRALD